MDSFDTHVITVHLEPVEPLWFIMTCEEGYRQEAVPYGLRTGSALL